MILLFLTLVWTAPIDNVGVEFYDIRTSMSIESLVNDWEDQYQLYSPAPSGPGEREVFTIGVRLIEGEHFFAIKSTDGRNLSEISNIISIDVSSDIPDSLPAFSFSQNYPNPFGFATTIDYALPRRQHVTICIYNSLGQKIETIVEGLKIGEQSCTWSGDLPSGVYFYQIKTESYTETKKMTILK